MVLAQMFADRGQIVGAARAVRQQIGHAQLRSDLKGPCLDDAVVDP
jgi:hypothetical protein